MQKNRKNLTKAEESYENLAAPTPAKQQEEEYAKKTEQIITVQSSPKQDLSKKRKRLNYL